MAEFKRYRVRLEVAKPVEIDIIAEHEDIAAARAEEWAQEEYPDFYVAAHEVEEEEDE